MRAFSYFKKHLRLYLSIFTALLIAVFALTQTFQADAKVAIFDSFFVDRQVEVKNDVINNTTQNLHTHTWSSFSGEIPEEVTINDISLVIAWSNDEDENVVEAVVELPTIIDIATSSQTNSVEEVSSSTELVVEEEIDSQLNQNEVGSSSDSTDGEDIEELEVSDVSEQVIDNEPLTEDPSEAEVEENIDDSSPSIEIDSVPEPIIENSPTTLLPRPSKSIFSLLGLIRVAHAYTVEGEDLSSVSEIPVVEVSETVVENVDNNLIASGTKDSVDDISSTTEEIIPMEVSYPTLQNASVQYSFDGDSWTDLGSINLLETNEAYLNLSIDTFASVSSLRVRIVYLAPQDAPSITFGNSQLKIDYTPFVIEEILPEPSDQEPNFLVSSVKLDVEKGGVRTVLLERGGVLELWAVILTTNEEEINWRRLASGNTLSEGMSIDIYHETVFWFEQNSHTLLAYDLGNESLIGTNQTDLITGTYILDLSRDKKMFKATFSADNGSFEFNQVYP